MTLPQIPPKLADLAAMRGTTTEAVSRTLTLAPPAGVENFDALRAIADDEHTGIARTGDRSG